VAEQEQRGDVVAMSGLPAMDGLMELRMGVVEEPATFELVRQTW